MVHVSGLLFGFILWFFVRYGLFGFYKVDQNERAVKTSFGRAVRINGKTTLDDPVSQPLNAEERQRYCYPQLKVIMPGGPYFKMPWEQIYKVSISTETVSMALDPEVATANAGGTILDAVTKDQLNIGLTGQIRYRVSERNLYAFLFGVKSPFVHVMGYFVSLLRERIASFEAPHAEGAESAGAISINDLRKNLRDINELMEQECISSAARYGIVLEASLITGIDPPKEVESALAAINTAHNHVSSDISLAQASADQRIVQSKKAVEIETMKADAEVKPLVALAEQLSSLKQSGSSVLKAYVQNYKLGLLTKAQEVIKENS